VNRQARVQGSVAGRPITAIIYEPTNKGGASLVLLAYDDEPKPASGEIIVGFARADAHAFVDRAVAAGGKVMEAVRDAPAHSLKVAFLADPKDT